MHSKERWHKTENMPKLNNLPDHKIYRFLQTYKMLSNPTGNNQIFLFHIVVRSFPVTSEAHVLLQASVFYGLPFRFPRVVFFHIDIVGPLYSAIRKKNTNQQFI